MVVESDAEDAINIDITDALNALVRLASNSVVLEDAMARTDKMHSVGASQPFCATSEDDGSRTERSETFPYRAIPVRLSNTSAAST